VKNILFSDKQKNAMPPWLWLHHTETMKSSCRDLIEVAPEEMRMAAQTIHSDHNNFQLHWLSVKIFNPNQHEKQRPG
jgi:hypothetical protein